MIGAQRKAFVLLRAQDESEGADLVPLAEARTERANAEVFSIEIDDLHLAGEASSFESMAIHAMFEQPNGTSLPFIAWRYEDGPVPSRTDHVRFTTPAGAVKRFELHYQLRGDKGIRVETMDLCRPGEKILSEGCYAVVVPRADGVPSAWIGSRFSGDAHAPVSKDLAATFDYLSMRISAVRESVPVV